MIVALVEPVLQEYVPVPDAVSVAVDPEQMVVFPLMDAEGGLLIVTVTVAVSVQPLAVPTITVYVALPVGVTVMEEVLAVVLHEYTVPPEAARVDEYPGQTEAGVAVTEAVGEGLTRMKIESAIEQVPIETVTVYVVFTEG